MTGATRHGHFARRRSALCALFFSALLLLFGGGVVMPADANGGGISVQLPSHTEECFFEDIYAADVKVFLHFTVTSGGSLDVDATIYGPDKSRIWVAHREAEGRVLFKSRLPGRHRFCFSNKMSTVTTKVVAFFIVVGEWGMDQNKKQVGHEMDSLERSVRRIQQGLREVQEVQRYLKRRERVHRATTEVANSRIFICSTVEIIMIVSLGLGNVWYIKRLFNRRRVV